MSNYKSIHKEGRDELIINKSRFIGTACPVETEDEALEFIDKVKREFKDATHNVYAYVIGENSNIQRYSDAGEPSGTAGMPVLNVINQENIKNAAVVVTRYFGGVLLGAGGLVRAYTKGSKIALESGIIVDKKLFYDVSFKIDYTLLGKMDNELVKNNFILVDRIYEDRVLIKLIAENENLDNIGALVGEITSGKAEISVGQAAYYSVKNGKIVE
ncbi:MAG TPA: YigZ family protein [Sedimentibacter sp.]|nr:YigZ family protein [Sedimentibacter sp.]HOH70045.1 YigZ family protein [Sedimentibacter sp.]HPX00318.1 YigZ family protein [Sedimentibacter sp.]